MDESYNTTLWHKAITQNDVKYDDTKWWQKAMAQRDNTNWWKKVMTQSVRQNDDTNCKTYWWHKVMTQSDEKSNYKTWWHKLMKQNDDKNW